jgi:hypothetical protein
MLQVRLFHVSEEPGIERFEPRAIADMGEPAVWAINEKRLQNYLVPRECPRVTYYAGNDTTKADVERFLGSAAAVIAIEDEWLERLLCCRLYCYRLPAETFRCVDECAGYFVSRAPVVPASLEVIDDARAELLRRGTELRVVPALWPLRDAVIVSSLRFSIIRMRNAKPRDPDGNRSDVSDGESGPA